MKTTTTVVALVVVLSTVAVPAAAAAPDTGSESVATGVAEGTVDDTAGAESPATRTDPSDTDAADGSSASPLGAAQASAPHDDPDEENETIGCEAFEGYRACAADTILVDNDDGIDQEELTKLVARAMARVEEIRDMEFGDDFDVTIRSREAYRRNVTGTYANITGNDALHQNVKYEATFMVGEDTDAIAKLAGNRAGSVQGFYSPSEDQIVVISNNPDALEMDEFTLGHELVHALQDQHFNLSDYNRTTEDRNNGINGIIEGDASLVEDLYREQCNGDGEWNGTCVRPTEGPGGGGDIHIGIYLISFSPYSDGPVLVNQVRQEGGWEAVNGMYDDPPITSEQVIHPEKYPDEKGAEIRINRSAEGPWEVLTLGNDSVDYATFGEAGLFSMFWYPSYEQRSTAIVDYNALFADARFDTYNYEHWITDGWNGDKLLPFVRNDSDGTNETAYVWKFEWDTEDDADQFVRGYERMLNFRNAEAVDDRVNTYVIPEDERFDDAFYVERSGTTVVVVNAPTVEDLSKIYDGAAPRPSDGTTTTTPADTTTTPADTTPADTTTAPTTEAPTTTDPGTSPGGDDGDGGGVPGFGFAVALLAILAGTAIAVRRRR